MTNLKPALAAGLAAAALALSFTNMIGGLALLQTAALATAFVISAVVLAAAAFVISLRRRSIVVAAMLGVTGIMIMIPAMAATGYFAAIVFPGPIIGVFFGLGVIGLGVAKGVGTAMAVAVLSKISKRKLSFIEYNSKEVRSIFKQPVSNSN